MTESGKCLDEWFKKWGNMEAGDEGTGPVITLRIHHLQEY